MSTYAWLIIGAILLAVELTTGTFYLLMLAIATIPAWVADRLGASFFTQSLIYLVCAAVLVWLVRRYRKQLNRQSDNKTQVDDLDAGAIVQVVNWQNGIGHTSYRGTNWQVTLTHPTEKPTEGAYRIVRLDGTRLLVQPI